MLKCVDFYKEMILLERLCEDELVLKSLILQL